MSEAWWEDERVVAVVEEWSRRADAGDVEAGYDLGMYRRMVDGDHDAALEILAPLADGGHVPSMRALAQLIAFRDEEPFDQTRALLLGAAQTGDAQASYELGDFLLHDACEPPQEAEPWLLAAAQQGHVWAMSTLVTFVYKPLGDVQSADRWASAVDAAGGTVPVGREDDEQKLAGVLAGDPWWRKWF